MEARLLFFDSTVLLLLLSELISEDAEAQREF
jgi:hypothetical protein